MIEIANFINENETIITSLEQLTFFKTHTAKTFLENSILMNLNFGFMKIPPFIFLSVLLILRFAANL